jgi:hypothetical protein
MIHMADEFAVIGAITGGVVAAATLYSAWKSLRALRAKIRAQRILQGSEDISEILVALRKKVDLSIEEQDRLIKEIEADLANRLSEEDRHYIDEGLHQPSAVGVQRFLRQIAGAA